MKWAEIKQLSLGKKRATLANFCHLACYKVFVEVKNG